MNLRDLDNYITGHYGEDQFKDEPDAKEELLERLAELNIRLAALKNQRTIIMAEHRYLTKKLAL